ncbi:MAG: hypothetical protein ACRDSN_02995, partial [Pseudonocardiaceae bacterium]
MAEAAEYREEAEHELREAHRRAEDAHRRFAAAAQAAVAEQERLGELVEQEESKARTLNTRGRELQGQVGELRRRSAQFRLDVAEAGWVEADDRRNEAHTELAAWRATEPLANSRAATAKVKVLGAQLSEAERDAVPLLERRAAAAEKLAGALLVRIDEARQQAEDADTTAATAREQAKQERNQEGDERARAGKLGAEAVAAEKQLERIDAERSRLVKEKMLARGQGSGDALAALDERQADAESREREATDRVGAIDKSIAELMQEAAAAAVDNERATDAAERIDADRTTLRERADELHAEERLRELTSVERLDVWRMGTALHRLLTEAIVGTERSIILLELEAADDQRAAKALEETGRLPAHRDAEAAVEALRGAGVPATTGWDYLSESVRAEERELLLRRLPALVGGIVLTNPAHRERAEGVLEGAALKPTTVVALGDSSELEAADEDFGERFVLPPNAALYD